MYRGSSPRIFPLIVIVLVIALVIAAVVSIGRLLFVGNSSDSSKSAHEGISAVVFDTGDSRAVRWTVRGPIVAKENFRSYQITISPTQRTFTTFTGYLDQAVTTRTYDNNRQAYEQFVHALGKADIATMRSASDTDMRGVCATHGLAFMFETMANAKADNSEWTSTCSGSKGTMTAKPAQVQALFVNQIPDFKPLFDQVY